MQGERKQQSGESGMLFCAFCCSHSLLQSGGSLASIITTVSLSLFPSHTHKHPLTLLLSHLLSASYTLLVHLSLTPHPPTTLPSRPLLLVTIRILISWRCCSSLLLKLTTAVNLCQPAIALHALSMCVHSTQTWKTNKIPWQSRFSYIKCQCSPQYCGPEC